MSAIPLPDRRATHARLGDETLAKVRELEAERGELVEALRRNALDLATYTAASLVFGVMETKAIEQAKD